MLKIDTVKLVKIVGFALTIGGAIASNWAGEKNNEKTLEKLVNDRLNNK